jgi:hypothetical protein
MMAALKDVKSGHSSIRAGTSTVLAGHALTQQGLVALLLTGSTMSKQQQPSKESVRDWLRARIAQKRPPPDPGQIRRELGWELIRTQPEPRR